MAYPYDDLPADTSYAASIGQQPPPLDAAGVLPGEVPPQPPGFAPPPPSAPVDFLAGELPPPPEPAPTFLAAPGIAPPPSAPPPPSLIPTIAPPPVAFPTELQRPPPTQVQQSAQELAQANAGIEEAQAQIDRLNARESQLRAELPTADPARQLAIAGELDATGRERAGIVTTRDTLRADAGRSAERGAVALETRQAEVMREEMALAERELEAASREAEEKRKTADEETARTREQVNRDTQAYRDALARKDPGADWQGVVEIVSESFLAGMQRRPPNFASIVDRSAARSRTNTAERAQAAATALGLSRDSLAGQQAIRQEIDVQEKARRVAIYEEATNRVQERMRTESDPLERARLGGQLDMLRQQRESALASAEQARAEQERTRRFAEEKMEIERAKAQVGITKTEAEIRKLAADTGKTEAEVRKLLRQGTGRAAPSVGLTAPNVVTAPDSDVPLVTFPNTREGIKEAAVTRDIVGGQVKVNDRIAGIERLFEDAEKKGLVASLGWERTGEWADLTSEIEWLKNDLASIKAGGLAVTDADDKWAARLVPATPKAWSSKTAGTAQINAIKTAVQNETRNQLQRKTRLDKQTREKVIASSRGKAISRRDVERQEVSQAAFDLVDPATSSTRKVQAVDQVEAQARQDAKDRGVEDDWLPLAAASLVTSLDATAVRGDTKAEDAVLDKLDKYARLARDRAEQGLGAQKEALRLGGIVGSDEAMAEAKANTDRANKIKALADKAKAKARLRRMSPEERESFFGAALELQGADEEGAR